MLRSAFSANLILCAKHAEQLHHSHKQSDALHSALQEECFSGHDELCLEAVEVTKSTVDGILEIATSSCVSKTNKANVGGGGSPGWQPSSPWALK